MEMLNEARKKHKFTNVWTADGKNLYKDVNDNKIKLYYAYLIIQGGCGRYQEMEEKCVANL